MPVWTIDFVSPGPDQLGFLKVRAWPDIYGSEGHLVLKPGLVIVSPTGMSARTGRALRLPMFLTLT